MNRLFLGLGILALVSTVKLHASSAGNDWPQFRGPDRTDVSKETGLLKHWPKEGPRRLWLFENAGKGYSGPAIAGGKLYTLGTREEYEVVIALDANTGKELWFSNIGAILGNDWGDGPRGTPSVDGDRVYAMSGQGILACVALADGKMIWQKKMSDLGGKRPGWGYTESVLVDGDKVLCTPGGAKGTMAALNKKSGELIWQTKDFTDTAHYSSIVPAVIHGKRQYIQWTEKHLVGVGADDGKVIWTSDWPGKVAVIPTPIYHDNHVYVTSGYGAGCKLVKIGPDNKATDVYKNATMQNHHGGVVLIDGHIYGHSDSRGWLCQNFKTGEEVWSEKSKLKKGAISAADGMLYCLEENTGTIALVEASPKGWTEHGRFTLNPQTKIRSDSGRIWTHPVISNGKLYLRDQDLIYCYDIKAK